MFRARTGKWFVGRCHWLAGVILVTAIVTTQETTNASVLPPGQVKQGTVNTAGRSGADLFRESCAACHGLDGKGREAETLGFDVPTPDFTDCRFAPREANADWVTVAHEGGPVRGFSKHMPAFGGAYNEADLYRIIEYVKTFCTAAEWPRGELNLPKALHTEKAFPEDEWVMTTAIGRKPAEITSQLVYEKRFGARNQIEIAMPFGGTRAGGNWNWAPGDLALGFKRAIAHNIDRGYILSLSGEVVLPTGDSGAGLSKDTTVFESFVTFGRLLPSDGFLQFQGGVEVPVDRARAEREVFWRMAAGKTFTQSGPFGRAWSPMVEILAARELQRGAAIDWDIVPQFQVTLNTRQHVRFNMGWRMPLTGRQSRSSRLVFYVLWDWFDGGLRDGW
jgi:mono/diheme cytochrome c family protein